MATTDSSEMIESSFEVGPTCVLNTPSYYHDYTWRL